MNVQRRASKKIWIGSVPVGGDAPVAIQSMTNTNTGDAKATLGQIEALAELDCDIVRVAVPDKEAAQALREIVSLSPLPIIADIHFDYRLALAALKAGVHALRLNPGNIRDPDKIRAVVAEAKARQVPIRVGVNEGSLPTLVALAEGEMPAPKWKRMVDAALWEIGLLEEMDFDLIKVSVKSFDVPTTVQANREIARLTPYPMHLGVTEAGLPKTGSVRNAIGIGILLAEGIGDTVRVSLTADPTQEVPVAWDILKAVNLRQRGPTIISCPTCGRIEVDLIPLAQKVEEHFQLLGYPLTVAVMGCVVNGPGEAREADIGLAAGRDRGAIFRKGQVVRIVAEKDFLSALIEEGYKVVAEKGWSGGPEGRPRSGPEPAPIAG